MKHPAIRSQLGITLLESLVAIVVAALGILGILGVQMRTLADTQTSVRRAQAIRLIEDLGERMKVNPNALGNLNNYAIGWGTATGSPPLTPQASKQCDSATCSHAELAAYDLREWKRAVERTLPLGDARIFVAPGEGTAENRRQLGVMISWRENERDSSGAYNDRIDTTKIIAADNSVSEAGDTVTCPADRTCHLQYIPVSARCAPYFKGAEVQYFCPGPKS
ncbi:type IV pilus modification protein PilV [Paenacidovorax monticola]|uniref:Type IV pilus modification protein PilV n=2 Tax=Paenacidovorax monticola TaxID=1926868 RepID=A0A7H0HK35_9BURK|nr:type IV pilus modification protein PilV [Paenacidovorax monticola]QNP60901.1 type IV pilus modification protein PilV [Paenacidovorax monticola]